MMEKLKGRQHGQAALDSVRRTIVPGRPSHRVAAPPIGGAMGAAFTPNKTATIAGGFSGFGGFGTATGAPRSPPAARPSARASPPRARVTPARRSANGSAAPRRLTDFRALRAACPFRDSRQLSARGDWTAARWTSRRFSARARCPSWTRRTSEGNPSRWSRCATRRPRTTLTEGLRLVCLTAPRSRRWIPCTTT